uniref:Protein preY, mitochondrial n=1 Tax=Solanum tuberosum TaxID=4113 RepID=M1C240_SOLTU
MVKFGRILLKDGINKKLLEILVCPLSKQPLRLCEKTNSLISDAIGVSYPSMGFLVLYQRMARLSRLMMHHILMALLICLVNELMIKEVVLNTIH